MAKTPFEDRITDPTGMTVTSDDGELLIDGKKVRREDVESTEVPSKRVREVPGSETR